MARSLGSLPLTCVALALLASPALGQTPASDLPPPPTERIVMRLDFAGVPGCSDPEPFILTLTPRVRWDPLAPDGRWRLVVTITKRAPGYEGTAELHDPKGDAVWPKPISIPPKASCFILLDRLSLKTAFRIDPPGDPPPAIAKPPAPPEPAKPPAPAELPKPPPVPPEPVVVSAAPPTAPERLRFVPQFGAGGWVDFGAAWGALWGMTFEGGFRRQEWERGGWSLMGALRLAPQQPEIGSPTSGASPDVSGLLVAGRLTACVDHAWPVSPVSLAGCVVGELGELRQSAGTAEAPNQHQTVLFAGGGGGLHIQGPLTDRFYWQMAANMRGVARLAGSTSQSTYVFGRSFGGAAGGFSAVLGVSF